MKQHIKKFEAFQNEINEKNKTWSRIGSGKKALVEDKKLSRLADLRIFETIDSIIDDSDVTKSYNSLSDPGIKDSIVDDTKRSMAFSDYEAFVYGYRQENDDKEMEEDDLIESEQFQEWVVEELKNKYDEILETFDYLYHSKDIEIFRVITIRNNKWLTRLNTSYDKTIPLGIYWSYEENAAEPHWGGHGINVHIAAQVNPNDVDWYQSMMANMNVSIGEMEKELTLKPKVNLNVFKIGTPGKEIEFNKNIKFIS